MVLWLGSSGSRVIFYLCHSLVLHRCAATTTHLMQYIVYFYHVPCAATLITLTANSAQRMEHRDDSQDNSTRQRINAMVLDKMTVPVLTHWCDATFYFIKFIYVNISICFLSGTLSAPRLVDLAFIYLYFSSLFWTFFCVCTANVHHIHILLLRCLKHFSSFTPHSRKLNENLLLLCGSRQAESLDELIWRRMFRVFVSYGRAHEK